MKTNGKYLNETGLEKAPTDNPARLYSTPKTEVVDIELKYYFLASGEGGADVEDFKDGGSAW